MEFSTLSARLVTFEPPTKRSKAGWPHKRPSAHAVAQAGFYYSPQSTGSDNVVCYLCDRYLDGWEGDDDPIEEHLKHSPECGWAIMMGIAREDKYDVTEMDDPTSASMADARRATFAANWPHDSKRGWACKTEKMVEAGWHFAPTDESEDWVTCAYCKLSLDGWEPKDNPFDEHYKRAPECVFFHFAGTTAPSKRPRAKKARSSKAARTSKASTRASTQSIISVQPEEVTINDVPDLDESIDTSTTSVVSTMSAASVSTTTSKRKAAGGRTKSTRTKKAKFARSTRTKKAKSEMEETDTGPEAEAAVAATALLDQETEMAQPPQQEDSRETQPEEAAVENPPSPTSLADLPVIYPTIPPAEPEPAAAPLSPSPSPSRNLKYRNEAAASPIRHHHLPPPSFSPSAVHDSDIENAHPPSAHSPSPSQPRHSSAVATPPLSGAMPVSTPASAPDQPLWTPVDVDLVFRSDPLDPMFQAAESFLMVDGPLNEKEKNMTVQEWIHYLAAQAEEELKLESERVVGVFAREGTRAMQVLEDLECL
ncbi:hypothetical protein DV736_g4188, partial [Chaetothyriales sp. CBS 134916]